MAEDTEDTPVLDTLAAMTAVSVEQCDLDPRELMLARIAALVAVDAPPVSYLLNAGAASDVGVTLEDVQGILIAVAPVVGTPRIMSAAGNITRSPRLRDRGGGGGARGGRRLSRSPSAHVASRRAPQVIAPPPRAPGEGTRGVSLTRVPPRQSVAPTSRRGPRTVEYETKVTGNGC